MAKKISRGAKRIMSLIFHLVVLFGMVTLYDTARAILNNDAPPPPPKAEKTTKASDVKQTGDGTFEKLMAEKQQKAKEKAAEDAKQKKSD
ncbi:MAG: hypothetical protein V4727_11505 [Verrucomicrobiota bacterium]